jgi:MFS family permease
MTPARRTVACVLLPFAAGYYLSTLFRTINALAAARLGAELGLGAAELGLLTAAYLGGFAAMQLPVGVALDRWGPRRVQVALLPVAAAGAAVFALAPGFPALLIGRALPGVGCGAALMAGLKALALWVPRERLALANGWYVMLGALGAATATAPAEHLLDGLGWRGLFALLAGATLATAAAIAALAPRDPAPPPAPGAAAAAAARLRDVWRSPGFWHVAPMSACCIGTAFALQGLWAAPWLADVALMPRPEVVRSLTAMALALCLGALAMGAATDRLRRRGVRPRGALAAVAAFSVLAQLALVLRAPVPALLPWTLLAAVGSATVLSYAALAEVFPQEVLGRANAALNLLHIGGAFLIQSALGLVIGAWPPDAEGRYPAQAYAVALALNLAPQVAAILWFLLAPPVRRRTTAGAAAIST